MGEKKYFLIRYDREKDSWLIVSRAYRHFKDAKKDYERYMRDYGISLEICETVYG